MYLAKTVRGKHDFSEQRILADPLTPLFMHLKVFKVSKRNKLSKLNKIVTAGRKNKERQGKKGKRKCGKQRREEMRSF